MADVPDRFIREESIDNCEEVLGCFNQDMITFNTRFSPFCLGVLSSLEAMGNKFISGDETATNFDYAIIFYLNKYRERALEDVAEYLRGNEKPLKRKVSRYIFLKKLLGTGLSYNSQSKIKLALDQAFSGYNLLPRQGGSSGAYLFGSEALAGVAYVACQKLGVDYNTLWWKTPMTIIGHIMAINAKDNGVKGVGRRKDEAHLMEIFRKCSQWDKENRLYPWQWFQPEFYPLTKTQVSDKIKNSHADRLKEIAENG